MHKTKTLSRLLFCLFLSGFLLSSQSFASDNSPSNAIKTMATILNYVNHYPGKEEKIKLQKIVDSKRSTTQEKTIATAMINLQHSASESDKRKLAKIISDNSSSNGAKDLAKIIKSMNHKPSSSDKKKLKQYMW